MPEYVLAREHFDAAWHGEPARETSTGHDFFIVVKSPQVILRRTDCDDNVTWWRYHVGHTYVVQLIQVDRRERSRYEYVDLL